MGLLTKAKQTHLGKKFGLEATGDKRKRDAKAPKKQSAKDEDDDFIPDEDLVGDEDEAFFDEEDDVSSAGDDDDEEEEEEDEDMEEEDEEGEDGLPAKAARKETTKLNFSEPADWAERMALVATKPLPTDLNPDDDPKREELFMQHTLLSAQRGIAMLEKADIPWKRPEDYFAEMYKSDVHMDKVQHAILRSKKEVEQRMHRRQMKDQKKFGKEVQAEVLRQRSKYKRDLQDKVASWRKKGGRSEDLDAALEDEKEPGKKGKGGRGSKRPPPGGKKNLRAGGGKRPGKNARRRKG